MSGRSRRSAGLLLHPTSLPSRFGIGDLGPATVEFLEWAQSAGQTLWQVMPLGPTGHFNSPYGCLSAFAGNPLLLSPERLVEEGLLPVSTLEEAPALDENRIDWGALLPWKDRLLRGAWEHARSRAKGEMAAFAAAPEQREWLDDWALFAALKHRRPELEWKAWDHELVSRAPAALAAARRDHAEEIAYQTFLQFLFFRQWDRLRSEAARRGIEVMGDVPIYVAFDSADVWAHRRFFTVDDDGRPEAIAGVPPDYFSATGQLWGSPLFRWDRLEEEGFSWWIERMRANFRLADLVRIDHFRGFAACWEVKAGEATALNGRWVTGPGMKLFHALRSALGSLPVVAEDLGHITDDVRELLAALGFPGMKVLQFAFGELDSDYLPHRHVPNGLVYTGTHDNDTTRGWFASAGGEERRRILDYLGTDGREIEWDLVRTAYASVADRAIVPLQDVLGLGSEARMNTPGRADGNWAWRVRKEELRPETAGRLRRLAEVTGRVAPGGKERT